MQRDGAPQWGRMRQAATSVIAGATLLALGACTGDSVTATSSASSSVPPTAQPASPSSLTRVPVSLPGPVTAMAATDAGLLLGTYAVSTTPRAGLTLVDPAAGSGGEGSARRAVRVTASTAYGKEGSWLALAANGTQVIGVAGQRGGAHGNVRWTIWRGNIGASGGAVAEEKQEFWTFGGYDMGGLSGVGYGAGQPVVVGGWKSEGTGLDIATWRAQGRTWVRANSARTALASTKASGLVAATAVIPMGSSVLLLGSTTLLGDGSVQVVPSIWTTTGSVIQSAWRRYDLPTGSATGQASVEAGGCGDGACLLAGRIGDRLALWRWDGRAASTIAASDVALGDQERIVGAGLVDDRPWLAIASGLGTGGAGTSSGTETAGVGTAGQAGAAPTPPVSGPSGPTSAASSASLGSSTAAGSTASGTAAGSPVGRIVHSADPISAAQLAWTVEPGPGGAPTAAGVAGGRFWVATDAPALWATPRLGLPAGR